MCAMLGVVGLERVVIFIRQSERPSFRRSGGGFTDFVTYYSLSLSISLYVAHMCNFLRL